MSDFSDSLLNKYSKISPKNNIRRKYSADCRPSPTIPRELPNNLSVSPNLRKLSIDNYRHSPSLLVTPAESIDESSSKSYNHLKDFGMPSSSDLSQSPSAASATYPTCSEREETDFSHSESAHGKRRIHSVDMRSTGLLLADNANTRRASDMTKTENSEKRSSKESLINWLRAFGRPLTRSRSAGSKVDSTLTNTPFSMENKPIPTQQQKQSSPRIPEPQEQKLSEPSQKKERKKKKHSLFSIFNRKASDVQVPPASFMQNELASTSHSQTSRSISPYQNCNPLTSDEVTQAPKSTVSKQGQQTKLEQLKHWGKSFDVLLSDPEGLQLFQSFLKTEYSEENILFWKSCEEFKNLHRDEDIQSESERIYNEFLSVQAPHEVNLDSKTRLQTISALNDPTPFTFDQAQKRIQALMEKDSYQRFLRSPTYTAMLQKLQTKGSGRNASVSDNNSLMVLQNKQRQSLSNSN